MVCIIFLVISFSLLYLSMNSKKELSLSKTLLYNTQLPILSPTTKRSTTTSRPKVSKTMTSTTKKPVLKFAYRLLGQNQEKYRLRNSSTVVFS